ncbi:MAG: HAD family hydrolase [Clostridia bacterium]|nr:HAD family hydrolase [Clostridia bacterium]
MSLKAVLFDLDGTLLPMDQDVFVKTYFGAISKKLAHRDYDPKELVSVIWQGTGEMIKNDGTNTNETVFWNTFKSIYGENYIKDLPYFDKFYEENFDDIKSVCSLNPKSAETVYALKDKGLRVILATNPIFPKIATEKRIAWAGLSPKDFELFTTYENICCSKPNLKYYEEILKRTGLKADECLMVGNDVGDDMVAEKLGMKVFLLTDCLINKDNVDITKYPNGSFDSLMSYINSL